MKLKSLIVSLLFASTINTVAEAKGRYIVTFKSEQGFQSMQTYMQQAAITENSNNAPKIESALESVNALVVHASPEAAEKLKSNPEVATVEAEFFTPVPRPLNGFKISKISYLESLDKAKKEPKIHCENKHNLPYPWNDGREPRLKVTDSTPWGIQAIKAGAAWQDAGSGDGARVAVLDTGIDAGHPAIACNFEKGRNFTEDENGEVDPKNYIDGEGHGTHVSGSILGTYNQKTGFTGVAPLAKLLMGRVCGTGGCSSIAIIEGIDWAIKQHVDVISMSLGGPVGSQAEQDAVTRAEKAGIVVVAASGNSATDPGYSPNVNDSQCGMAVFGGPACGVSFPGAFATVISVGAVDSKLTKTKFSQWGPELDITAPGAAVISSVPRGTGRESEVKLTANGTSRVIKSAAFSGTILFPDAVVKDVVAVPGLGKPEDFAGLDVEGKIALISRGEIKFSEKVANALEARAAGVLIYNNVEGLMQGSLSEDGTLLNIPVTMIEKAEGLALLDQLQRGQSVSAAVKTSPTDYASFDGTSMATPHVAGVVALMKAANPDLSPAQVRKIIAETALKESPNDTNQFGAGVIQADKAVAKAAKLAW